MQLLEVHRGLVAALLGLLVVHLVVDHAGIAGNGFADTAGISATDRLRVDGSNGDVSRAQSLGLAERRGDGTAESGQVGLAARAHAEEHDTRSSRAAIREVHQRLADGTLEAFHRSLTRQGIARQQVDGGGVAAIAGIGDGGIDGHFAFEGADQKNIASHRC